MSFSERFKFYDHYGQPHVDRIAVLLGEGAKVSSDDLNTLDCKAVHSPAIPL